MLHGSKGEHLDPAQEIDGLRQVVDYLQGELSALRDNPYVQLGLQIEEEVTNDLAVAGEGANDEAIIARYTEKARQAAVEAQTAQLIERDKEKIIAVAALEAAPIAWQGLQRFRETEGPAFRESSRRQLIETQTPQLIEDARRQVAREERERLVAEHAERIRQQNAKEASLDNAVDAEREAFRDRAEALRKITRRSHILEMDKLQEGDPLTLMLVTKGHGYSQRQDQYMIPVKRELTVKLLNAHTGAVEVVEDSWLDEPDHRDMSLRGGANIVIASDNPDKNNPWKRVLVKGQPVFIGIDGKNENPGGLELWWVNLDEFKALS